MNKTLLFFCLLTAIPAPAVCATLAQAQDVQDLLHGNYYAIEFFVFERPRVLEFNTTEILALDRPRRLPLAMRIQKPDPDQLWPLPIDPWTRACLTFPTLDYRLQPPPTDESLPPEPVLAEQTPALPESDVPGITPVLAVDPVLTFMTEVADFEHGVRQQSDRWLAEDGFQLRAAARRVERTGLGRVLFHGRWIQAVPPRETPDPILVEGGQVLPGAVPVAELVGTVGVTLGRYLHFQTELYFHAPGLGLLPVSVPLKADGTPVPGALPPITARYMTLAESRRMRSEEIHYLDHPKLGLVVRIDPVPIPEQLVESFDLLKESLE